MDGDDGGRHRDGPCNEVQDKDMTTVAGICGTSNEVFEA